MKTRKRQSRPKNSPQARYFNKLEALLREETVFQVEIYRNPWPDNWEAHTGIFPATKSRARTTKLMLLTLFEPDFDILLRGIQSVDLFKMANSVLRLLGPEGRQYMGRTDDYIYGWNEETHEKYGTVILLEITAREHKLSIRN